MKLEELAEEVSKLPTRERAALAAEILHGLDAPEIGVKDEEVARRMAEAEKNPSVFITHEELVEGLKYRGG